MKWYHVGWAGDRIECTPYTVNSVDDQLVHLPAGRFANVSEYIERRIGPYHQWVESLEEAWELAFQMIDKKLAHYTTCTQWLVEHRASLHREKMQGDSHD